MPCSLFGQLYPWPGPPQCLITLPAWSNTSTGGGATQHFACGGFSSAARSRLLSDPGRCTTQRLLLRSTVMPDTWPSSQLFGKSFGHSASTWYCGTPDFAAGFCASAGLAASAANAMDSTIVLDGMTSSRGYRSRNRLRHLLRHLRHAFLARDIEREDPGPVKEGRRRYLPVVGELLTRLQCNTGGARLALGHIGAQRCLDIVAVAGEAAREHVAILDRHVTTLSERRHGGVRGIAEERHPAFGPLRYRIAVVD